MYYKTCIQKCKNGYHLRGTVPQYMTMLIFTSYETAKEAYEESLYVLETGDATESKFSNAYWNYIEDGNRHVD